MKVIKGVRTPAAETNVADVRAIPITARILGITALFNYHQIIFIEYVYFLFKFLHFSQCSQPAVSAQN